MRPIHDLAWAMVLRKQIHLVVREVELDIEAPEHVVAQNTGHFRIVAQLTVEDGEQHFACDIAKLDVGIGGKLRGALAIVDMHGGWNRDGLQPDTVRGGAGQERSRVGNIQDQIAFGVFDADRHQDLTVIIRNRVQRRDQLELAL